MELNLHVPKVVCLPCAAVLKGQTTQRKAEAAEGLRANLRFASHTPDKGPEPPLLPAI